MCLVPLLVASVLGADPDHIAKKITLKEAAFDSLDGALHVIRHSGTVELSAERGKGKSRWSCTGTARG
jgi:hypothetical protein